MSRWAIAKPRANEFHELRLTDGSLVLIADSFGHNAESRTKSSFLRLAVKTTGWKSKSPQHRGRDHRTCRGLAGGKKTPLVIGVKVKRASCLSWSPLWHTFHQCDLTVCRTLAEPFTPSPSLLLASTLCTLAAFFPPPPPFLTSPRGSVLLSVWQQRAELMSFRCWWGGVCRSCTPALSCSRLREHSSGSRRQLQRQNATEGFGVSHVKRGCRAQHKAQTETLRQIGRTTARHVNIVDANRLYLCNQSGWRDRNHSHWY